MLFLGANPNHMIRSIAVDDEPSALDVIRIHAAQVPELDLLDCFTDPLMALEFLKNNRVDLIFLDINMPGLSGLDLLNRLKFKPRVVFTTAYSEYALDSYEFEAVDYLMKPIEFDRFYRSVQRYLKQSAGNGNGGTTYPEYIFVKDGYRQVKVVVDEITHIQSQGNYLDIFTGSGRTVTRMTLSQMQELLPANRFIRIHNSFVVNLSSIDRIENNQVLIGDAAIPVGAKYRDGFFLLTLTNKPNFTF